MAHHKRKGPKSTRAGCLMCKWHKHQAFNGSLNARRTQVKKQTAQAVEQIREAA